MRHRQVPGYRRNIGVVFQDFRLIDEMNVYDNVAFAMHAVEAPGRLIKKRVPQVLQEVGLSDKSTSFPNQLSGGEKQRVAIARAIVNNPQILLADEPTGNLDPRNSYEIMKLIERINEQGTTVLMVTHDKGLVDQFQKRVIAMRNGSIARDVEEGGYIEA
jgi:cell division transport system ATP-binding protein